MTATPITVLPSTDHSLNHLIDITNTRPEDCFLISKKHISRRSILSISSGETDKDQSTFSSLSNYTLTMEEISDLNRQVEELHNQITVTQERNTHVENELVSAHKNYTDLIKHMMTVQSTQDDLIVALETRHENSHKKYTVATENLIRDLGHLSLDREQLTLMFDLIERRLSKQDKVTANAIEDLEQIKSQWSKQRDFPIESSSDVEQIELLRSQRDRFYHQWKQQIQHSDKTQQSLELEVAHCSTLEKRIGELESDLNISQELLRQQDTSGRIQRFEIELEKVRQQKRLEQEDFEKSYQDALNEINSHKKTIERQSETISNLQSTTRVLHQQLSNSIEKAQNESLSALDCSSSGISMVSTYGEADLIALKEKIEQEEKVELLCSENARLRSSLEDAEMERHRLAQKLRALERDFSNFSENNCRLDRASRGSQGSLESNRSSKTCLSKSASKQNNLSKHDPPSNPPTHPIPNLPHTSSDQSHKIAQLELKLHQQQLDLNSLRHQQALSDRKLQSANKEIEQMSQKLKQEIALKLKAERGREILEYRMTAVMNKKSKYLCF